MGFIQSISYIRPSFYEFWLVVFVWPYCQTHTSNVTSLVRGNTLWAPALTSLAKNKQHKLINGKRVTENTHFNQQNNFIQIQF